MAAPYRIQESHKQDVAKGCPASARGDSEVLVQQKKAPMRIVPPKGSLKQIEKDIVKRKTQLFEQGDVLTSQHGNKVLAKPPIKTPDEPSPLYKPSFEIASRNSNTEPKAGNTVPSCPYKPKSDARISKAIGVEAKAKLEQLQIKKSNPPERPKMPPSPIPRDKPRYPYKPSVENEIDAHGKITKKLAQNPKLTVNTNVSGKDDKTVMSPKSPSPPIRPPPPKFQNTDKKVSTLIAHKSKLFEGEGTDSGKTDTPLENPDNLDSKPKRDRKSSARSHFESVQFQGGVPKIVNEAQEVRSETNTHSIVDTGSVPQYSRVNKAKKVIEKDLESLMGQGQTNITDPDSVSNRPNRNRHVVSAAPILAAAVDSEKSTQTLTKKSASSERIAPPAKPPRTFAHDDYIKLKAEKQQKKKQHLGTPSPLATVHNYEEIGNNTGRPPPPPSKPTRIQSKSLEPFELYEEVAQPSKATTKPRTSKPDTDYQDIAVNKSYTYDKLDDSGVFAKPLPPSRPGTYTYDKLDESGVFTKPALPSKPVLPLKPDENGSNTSKTNAGDKNDKTKWEKGMLRINAPNPRLKKEPIISKKAIANPGYEPWSNDCIPIKTYYKDGTLKKYKSDECLYAENHLQKNFSQGVQYNEEPLYQDPADVVRDHKALGFANSHGVTFDGEGYAMPSVGQIPGKTNKRYQKRDMKRTGTLAYGAHHHNNNPKTGTRANASVKEKVSEAYSVLRRRTVRQENGGAEGDSTGCYRLEDADDSDSDLDTEEHQKHMDYVCTNKLRLKNSSQYRSVYEKAMLKSPPPPDPSSHQVQQLFDYGLIVGLEEVGDTKICRPKMLHCFPHQETVDIGIISSFCFPDASVWRPVSHYRPENFSFVLTAGDGSRQYGYCRRFLPPQGQNTNRLPEVFCLVSSLCAWNFYADLLKELQERRKNSVHLAQDLLQLAYAKLMPKPGKEVWIGCPTETDQSKPMPKPGKEVWISCPTATDQRETVCVKRSAEDKLDKVSASLLLEKLSVDNLLKVFSSLLLERRLIFIAQHLGTLTDCIHALLSLLYPFTWQHTFIPVLPGELLEVCDAPTPYVVGVLAGHYPQIQEMCVDDVIIVDLNNDSVLKSMRDESAILPPKLQKALRSALKPDNSPQGEKDLMVTEAFLRMFIETVGHYTDFINVQQNGLREFHRDAFVRAVSSRSIKMFLEWFSETQMFEVFITTKMDSPSQGDGLFEQRLVEYRDEMEKLGPTVKQNIKDAGKRVINFFKESGGKIKKVFV